MGAHHRMRRIGDAIEAMYAGVWLVLLALLVLCGPGMIIGNQLAGRPGEVVGALVVPVAIGVPFAITGVIGARRERESARADADAEAVQTYADLRRSSNG